MSAPGRGEAQTAHHFVRLHVVAQQIPRAKLGAVAALVARRFADVIHLRHGARPPRDQVMIARQQINPPVVLVTTSSRSNAQRAHHQAADEHADSQSPSRRRPLDATRGTACPPAPRTISAASPRRTPKGTSRVTVPPCSAWWTLYSVSTFVDHAAHLQRNARPAESAGLWPCRPVRIRRPRIKIAQHHEFDAPRWNCARFSASSDSAFFVLIPNLPASRRGVHHGVMPERISAGKVPHHLRVFVDQRLAFGAVGNQILHLRLRFDVRRKAGAACSHHACSRNCSLSINQRITVAVPRLGASRTRLSLLPTPRR